MKLRRTKIVPFFGPPGSYCWQSKWEMGGNGNRDVRIMGMGIRYWTENKIGMRMGMAENGNNNSHSCTPLV